MRRVLNIFLIFIIFFSSLSIGTIVAHADGEHQFSLNAYNCNELNDDMECLGPNGNVEDDLSEILNNDNVEPGKVIKLSLYYIPGDITDISMQIGIKYDPTMVKVIYDADEIYITYDESTTYQGGIWPAAGTSTTNKKRTNWQVLANDDSANNTVKFIIQDSKNAAELETEGTLVDMYFKVKDDVSAGGVINFSFDESYTKMAKKTPVITNGINVNVFGTMSNNKTLSSLTIKSDSIDYPLDPAFVPGSMDNKEFNVVVPNQVTNVDLDATTTDSYSLVASGNANHTLDVGNNKIKVIVQAQNGEIETYIVNVYRLNNDASLKSLSLSDNINIENFNSSQTMYTATVLYSISRTTVTAITTDLNARILNGTGLWELNNYGTVVNTNDIVINAENCDSKYNNVTNNSCTSKTYTIKITRESPSSNTYLSDLSINGTTIENFNKNIYEYTLPSVANNVSSLNLSATVEDTEKAKIISTLGNKNLNVGDNKLSIKVEAEDKSIQEYIINVRRLSNDSKLSNINVTSDPTGVLTPSFSSTFYNYYTYTAPSTVETVNISANVNDPTATIISGPGTYNINNVSSVNITVQAEDGTTSIYVVKLVREKSSNNNLKSLTLDGYSLNETFNPGVTLYTANVSGNVDTINVSAMVEDTLKATIISGIGSHNLNVGNNTIQIRVQAENGAIKDYTITVTRAKKSIAALTSLTVDGVSVKDFSETELEYTIDKVDFEKTTVLIDAVAKDSDSKVTGTGYITLNTGNNKLYVIVTAEDGITQTRYIINIERAKDDNAYLSDIKIDNISINGFNKENLEYNITVENNIKSLNLNAIKESDLATVNITGNNNFITTGNNVVTITVTSESGNLNIYKINVTRKKSTNNYLSNIALSTGLLDPTFNKEINEYTVNVDRSVSSVTITPTLEDLSANYKIEGPQTLQIGTNEYIVTVTSESGGLNVYKINVNRNSSNNNYLSSISLDGSIINNFNRETELYTINVPSTKENITISAEAEEIYSSIIGIGTFNLESGINTFPIIVEAENKSRRTYSIVINKDKSDDSTLSSLSVSKTNINPNFSPDILNYTANVAYTVTDIDIQATVTDSKATITGTGSKKLKTGDNTFDIVVTSENNTTTTYTIVVTRSKNDNANLSNIIISGGFSLTPNFSESITSYDLTVPNNVDSLDITAYKQDPNALSVEGDGTVRLNTGDNTISIIVTAENGTTKKTYNLVITREKSNNADLSSMIISDGILSPSFNSNITQYEVIVPYEVDNLNIEAKTSSPNAQITSITGNNNLTVGTNNASVTVIAEDGTLKIYSIKILRQPSTNNFLDNLSIKDNNNTEYIDTFLKTKLNYNITVSNEIDKIIIDAKAEDNSSKVVGLGEKTLDIGNNSLEIGVTSASGIERVYVVNIIREANSNDFLSNLEVVGYNLTPKFNKSTYSYTLDVDSLVDKVIINATPEVNTTTVVGTGEFILNTNSNTFNIDVTSAYGTSKTYVIVINKAASDNNYLSNLAISPGTLDPSFNKNILEYNVHVDNSTTIMDISTQKEHDKAQITGDGVKSISVGSQTFNINVKAENNEVRTYKINVTRDASSNNDLSDLKIDGTTIDNFNKDELSYSINVLNNVDKITISADVIDETALVSGTGVINLNTGVNTIPITVTAEDGSIKTYEIIVTRAKSTNNYLSSLNVLEGNIDPEFNKNTLIYSVEVPYEVDKLTINAKTEDPSATIEIDGNNSFNVGPDNKVYVNVIAEDLSIKSYLINVTRHPQVNNFLTDLVITDNDGTRYSLNKEFNKNILNYEVELASFVNEINISVQKEQMSLTVIGDGKVAIDSLPKVHKITVSTTGGLQRTYTIKFTRGLSSNKYLSSLSVDKGTLSPEFRKDETAYNVDLDSSETEITVSATKEDENQTITGLGTYKLVPGRNTIKIIVTSESGDNNIYNIFVNVNANIEDNTNVLDSLSVDKGELTPKFNKNIKSYTVDLDSSETEITINATGNNTIEGTGTHKLVDGANVFEIISKDDDGNINTYKIVVNNPIESSSYLSGLSVTGYQIGEFNKEKYSYSLKLDNIVESLEVLAVAEDKNSNVTITGNDNLSYGNNIISIVVIGVDGNSITYTIDVFIGLTKISSNIHAIDDTYIKTINENKTSINVKDEMINPNENLKIYDLSGNEVDDNSIVATGYTIKLIIDEKEYDSKILIIKGDVNSDGKVEVSDIIKLRLDILDISKLNSYQTYAADINTDGTIEVSDIISIQRHILGNLNLFKKESE